MQDLTNQDGFNLLTSECCHFELRLSLLFSSTACISKYSAGSIFYYPSFHHIHNPAQVEKLQRDLERYFTRKIGFEAVMRIRCTKGNGSCERCRPCNSPADTSVRVLEITTSSPVLSLSGLSIHTFHGNFFVRSTDLLSLANVNPDSAFAVQMSIEDSLADSSLACFQAALLYTSSKGTRRSSNNLAHQMDRRCDRCREEETNV